MALAAYRPRSGAWWGFYISALMILLALAATALTPALAHKDHNKGNTPSPRASSGAQVQAGSPVDPAMHTELGERVSETPKEAPPGTLERLLDWLGRLHPILVHFPIAFFPAALFTAVVGRRRPAFGKPVQFLVVAGGLLAPIAAALGWLGALNAKADPVLTAHQWLGTAIGLAGLALAIWAWRRPDEDPGVLMLTILAAITVAVVAQGWFGGALVHGIDHLDW